MSRRSQSVMAMLVAVLPLLSFAQSGADYRCRIEHITMPGVPKSSMEFWQKAYEGKEFTVDRQTGIMAGTLKMSSTTKPLVIDAGSDQNSFKAVTTMRRDQGAGAGSNVYVLVIREFAKGPGKPFLFVDNEDTFVGTCEHF
jgi:hypothetical protein